MPSVIENVNNLEEIVQTISMARNEPESVRQMRINALKDLQQYPIPDRVSHVWKYSDPLGFEIGQRNISLTTDKCLQYEGEPDYYHPLDLGEHFQKNLYGKLITPSRLTCINDAFYKGFFIRIPSGTKQKTLRYKFHSQALNAYECVRGLILVEQGSDVNIIGEFTANDADAQCINAVIEIVLENDVSLNYLSLHTQGSQAIQHLYQRTKVGKNSNFTNLIIGLGGKLSKCDLGVKLAETNSATSIHGIVLGDALQRFDHHTRIHHLAPHTKSELDFRVALKDKARSAYTGNLKISHEAIKSDAHQENRNLLLSEDAKAESIPELEILTNDVIRCNHGVTVGRVDKSQIYYLMSRGLTEKEAERLIIEGFLEPTISKIPDENLKKEVEDRINAKLQIL